MGERPPPPPAGWDVGIDLSDWGDWRGRLAALAIAIALGAFVMVGAWQGWR